MGGESLPAEEIIAIGDPVGLGHAIKDLLGASDLVIGELLRPVDGDRIPGAVVCDGAAISGLHHDVVAQCVGLDRKRDREDAGVDRIVRIVPAVEVDHAHQGLVNTGWIVVGERMGNHEVAVVSVAAADLGAQVGQLAGVAGPKQQLVGPQHSGIEIQLSTHDFGLLDDLAPAVDLLGAHQPFAVGFTLDIGDLGQRLEGDLPGGQCVGDIRLIDTAESTVVIAVLLLEVQRGAWNFPRRFLFQVVEGVGAAVVVDGVSGGLGVFAAHAGVLETRRLLEPVHIAVADAQRGLGAFDVGAQELCRIDIRKGLSDLGFGGYGRDGCVHQRSAADPDSPKNTVCAVVDFLANSGLDRLG